MRAIVVMPAAAAMPSTRTSVGRCDRGTTAARPRATATNAAMASGARNPRARTKLSITPENEAVGPVRPWADRHAVRDGTVAIHGIAPLVRNGAVPNRYVRSGCRRRAGRPAPGRYDGRGWTARSDPPDD